MKLKWGNKELKYGYGKSPDNQGVIMERARGKSREVNDWAWWPLFGTMLVMEIILILKILGKI